MYYNSKLWQPNNRIYERVLNWIKILGWFKFKSINFALFQLHSNNSNIFPCLLMNYKLSNKKHKKLNKSVACYLQINLVLPDKFFINLQIKKKICKLLEDYHNKYPRWLHKIIELFIPITPSIWLHIICKSILVNLTTSCKFATQHIFYDPEKLF